MEDNNNKVDSKTNNILFCNPNSPNNPLPELDFFKDFNILQCEFVVLGEKGDSIIDEKIIKCKIVLTEYRFITKPQINEEDINDSIKDYALDYYTVPVYMISKVEKSIDRKQLTKMKVDILTKDNRSFSYYLQGSSNVYTSLTNVLRPKSVSTFSVFARKYRDYHPVNYDGWLIYDCVKEYQRQLKDSKCIRQSSVNALFKVCDTYPEITYIPTVSEDNDVKEAAQYRTKQRFPALAYFYGKSNGSIWRSSQTRTGLTNSRSIIDEKILSAIADISILPNKLIIYDARPYMSAYANKFKGAGFENVENYPKTEIIFCEIDHIHAVRASYQKIMLLTDAKSIEGNKNFFSQFELSGWNNFIYQIIKTSITIAKAIREGYSVLVHCSDGWDRASQLSAFPQLIIDPYYRTFEGFIVLIEKEFLSFGHQFGIRGGFCQVDQLDESQISPIFLQWLDCVHQLVIQFAFHFEFNIDLLVYIAYHLNSCKYGSFLYNSNKERQEQNVSIKTVSIWSDVLSYRHCFINPYYDKETMNDFFMIENFSFYKIRLWEEYFLRYSIKDYYSKELLMRNTLTQNNNQIESMKEMNIAESPINTIPISNYALLLKNKAQDHHDINQLKKDNQVMKDILKDLLNQGKIDLNNQKLLQILNDL